jgi:hypothetical protein
MAILKPCVAQNTPKLEGDSIPSSPEQSQPWTPPPSKLPPLAISAITELFNEGLADPRGLEYREIGVKTGIELNIKTHGWIIPGTGQSHFAVGWNGLVYPVVLIGSPADLQKDVANLIAKDQKQWGSYTGSNRDVRGHWPVPEWVAISQENILPLKAALLLRLGRADLAEAIWKRWFALSAGGQDDPYLLLAREWIDSLYGRTLYEHLRGDDALALTGCRMLIPLQSTVEAAAARRGFAKDASGKPYLEGLEELPKLYADQERRAREQPYVPVLTSGQPAQGPERIAALIRDLELVDARQEMNPGQTDVSTDPIVHALIEEGDSAVEPLLKCFEEDTRLTRSEFIQGMQIKPGELIPVYEPAFVAIIGILKMPFSLTDSTTKDPRNLSLDDRKALAAKVRAYWESHKSMTPPERWYATLQDDKAGASAWFQAVDNIVQRNTEAAMPSTMFGGGWWAGGGVPQGAPVVLNGEPLRTKSNPSLSDLIIRRYQQLIVQSRSDPSIPFDAVGKLILALATWDGKAHLEDIREMAEAFHERFPHEEGAFVSTLQTEATIYRKRIELGDTRALLEYADWLVAIHPNEWNDFFLTNPFQIMWHYPNEPVIQRAAEKLFGDKNSPWIPLTHVHPANEASTLTDLVTTPLIGLAAFRQEVLRRLDDRSIDGTLQISDNGNVGCMLTDDVHHDFTVGSWKGDPLVPPAGSSIPLRTCDYFAYKLSSLDGFPRIELYWPQVQRDAAVAACKTALTRYGDAFQDRPGDPYDDSVYGNSDSQTHLTLPRLDHPATDKDVKEGRAIFQLSGTTRIWNMPDFPLGAERPSVKYDPVTGIEDSPDGKTKTVVTYTTAGKVWQAEEVLIDGRWQRYYGFQGRYQLEKVPASEIVFPSGPEWISLNGSIDGQLTLESARKVSYAPFASYTIADAASPCEVTIRVRNHNGLDENLPADFVLPPNATRTLPGGISFSLLYSEKIPPEVLKPPNKPHAAWWIGGTHPPPPFDYGTWKALPLRKDIQVVGVTGSGPVLGAAHEIILLKIDVRNFFDMTRPGSYRLTIIFHLAGQADHKSNETTFSVVDAVQ